MGRTIGCWSWKESDSALVPDDGAVLRFVGEEDGDRDSSGGRSLRFEIGCAEGTASVQTVTYHRDETYRTDFTDYRAADGWIRLVGARSRFTLSGVLNLVEESAAAERWRPASWTPSPPSLGLWRNLRDAAQSGLRPGESVTVTGAWIFSCFFGGPQLDRIAQRLKRSARRQ